MFVNLWRNKYFRYFIIISLLAHVIIYFLFFNVGFKSHGKNMIKGLCDCITLSPEEYQKRIKSREELFKKLKEIKQERIKDKKIKDKDNGLPAQLRAKKSDFGWVLFDDPPSESKTKQIEVPTTQEGDVGQAVTPHATELVPTSPKEPVKVEQPPVVQSMVTKPVKARHSIPSKGERRKSNVGAKTLALHEKPAQKEEEPKELKYVEPEAQKVVPEAQPPAERPSVFIDAQPIIEQKKPARSVHTSERKLKKDLQARNEESPIGSLMDELNESANDEQPEQYAQVEAQEDIFAAPAQPSPDIQARIDRIARRQEQVSNFAPTVATSNVRGAKSIHNNDKRGIIALTKGYVENLTGDGEDLIDRDGDPNKRPSFEEMKYISYEAKINWSLQAAWKQNFAYNQTTRVREGKAVVEFTIDAKGYIKNSELLQSSGCPELDKLIMKNTELASPFPPLPKHFGVENYTTGRVIHVFSDKRWY